MSTISEIDIRDWEQVDLNLLKKDIEQARYGNIEDDYDVTPYDAYNRALDMVEQLILIRDKQIKEATKNVAALFKPKES